MRFLYRFLYGFYVVALAVLTGLTRPSVRGRAQIVWEMA